MMTRNAVSLMSKRSALILDESAHESLQLRSQREIIGIPVPQFAVVVSSHKIQKGSLLQGICANGRV
jgi:hypothetical protein